MEPIVHFLLSIIAGLGVGLHIENRFKKYSMIILIAILATALDLDHLFPAYLESGIKILHNIFIFVFLPVLLLLLLIAWEAGSGTTQKQRLSLLLCVMFPGHMFTDIISGAGVSLFYPFNTSTVTVGNIGLSLNSPLISLQAYQVLLIVWGMIILCANLTETFTYADVEGRKTPQQKSYDKNITSDERRSWLPSIYFNGAFSQRSRPWDDAIMGAAHQNRLPIIDMSSMILQINEISSNRIRLNEIPINTLQLKEIPTNISYKDGIPPDILMTNKISPEIKPANDEFTRQIFSFVDNLSNNKYKQGLQ